MSYWRMPWNRNVGPIGLDLGAECPRAMQVRVGPDAPRESVSVQVDAGATLVQRAAAAAQALRTKSRAAGSSKNSLRGSIRHGIPGCVNRGDP